MPERPFPRDLARIVVEGGIDDDEWKVVTMMLDKTFLESYTLKKIDPESPTREHAMAERPFPMWHDCEYTAGARKGESTSESSTMEQIMPKLPTNRRWRRP